MICVAPAPDNAMMNCENRYESRVENVFHSGPAWTPEQLYPTDIYTSSLSYFPSSSYDVPMHLMEGNALFDRNLSADIPKHGLEPKWQNREIIDLNPNVFQRSAYPSPQSPEKYIEGQYFGSYDVARSMPTSPRSLEPKETPLLGENSEQEELSALQWQYYAFLMGLQNAQFEERAPVQFKPERPEPSPFPEPSAFPATFPATYPVAFPEPSTFPEPPDPSPSQAPSDTKKKPLVKKAPKEPLLVATEDPFLPLEWRSPSARWELHCKKHGGSKMKKGKVGCPHCKKVFNNVKDCAKHLDEVGEKYKNICPDETCWHSVLGFKIRALLRRHICNDHLKTHHRRPRRADKDSPAVKTFLKFLYVCQHKDCQRPFYRLDSLMRHQRLTHSTGARKKKLKLLKCDREAFE